MEPPRHDFSSLILEILKYELYSLLSFTGSVGDGAGLLANFLVTIPLHLYGVTLVEELLAGAVSQIAGLDFSQSHSLRAELWANRREAAGVRNIKSFCSRLCMLLLLCVIRQRWGL